MVTIKMQNTRVDIRANDEVCEDSIITSQEWELIQMILDTDLESNYDISVEDAVGSNHWWLKSYERDAKFYRIDRPSELMHKNMQLGTMILDTYLDWIANMSRILIKNRTIDFDYHIPYRNVIKNIVQWYDRQSIEFELTTIEGDNFITYSANNGVLKLKNNSKGVFPAIIQQKYYTFYNLIKSRYYSNEYNRQTKFYRLAQFAHSIMEDKDRNDQSIIFLCNFRKLFKVYGEKSSQYPHILQKLYQNSLSSEERVVFFRLLNLIGGRHEN